MGPKKVLMDHFKKSLPSATADRGVSSQHGHHDAHETPGNSRQDPNNFWPFKLPAKSKLYHRTIEHPGLRRLFGRRKQASNKAAEARKLKKLFTKKMNMVILKLKVKYDSEIYILKESVAEVQHVQKSLRTQLSHSIDRINSSEMAQQQINDLMIKLAAAEKANANANNQDLMNKFAIAQQLIAQKDKEISDLKRGTTRQANGAKDQDLVNNLATSRQELATAQQQLATKDQKIKDLETRITVKSNAVKTEPAEGQGTVQAEEKDEEDDKDEQIKELKETLQKCQTAGKALQQYINGLSGNREELLPNNGRGAFNDLCYAGLRAALDKNREYLLASNVADLDDTIIEALLFRVLYERIFNTFLHGVSTMIEFAVHKVADAMTNHSKPQPSPYKVRAWQADGAHALLGLPQIDTHIRPNYVNNVVDHILSITNIFISPEHMAEATEVLRDTVVKPAIALKEKMAVTPNVFSVVYSDFIPTTNGVKNYAGTEPDFYRRVDEFRLEDVSNGDRPVNFSKMDPRPSEAEISKFLKRIMTYVPSFEVKFTNELGNTEILRQQSMAVAYRAGQPTQEGVIEALYKAGA
ncbi:hypothetical protein SCAR479_13211 [Seiridium cardinale]|uniref:Uncharacterized protein n=1 Tax=Seiridium cardinale TaxID=138064 RepID=A0ABR2X8Q2_9PEZI